MYAALHAVGEHRAGAEGEAGVTAWASCGGVGCGGVGGLWRFGARLMCTRPPPAHEYVAVSRKTTCRASREHVAGAGSMGHVRA